MARGKHAKMAERSRDRAVSAEFESLQNENHSLREQLAQARKAAAGRETLEQEIARLRQQRDEGVSDDLLKMSERAGTLLAALDAYREYVDNVSDKYLKFVEKQGEKFGGGIEGLENYLTVADGQKTIIPKHVADRFIDGLSPRALRLIEMARRRKAAFASVSSDGRTRLSRRGPIKTVQPVKFDDDKC